MGVMNKMRENTAVVLYVLVGAFGVLWVLQDSGMFDAIGVRTGRDVARVNGEPVPMDQYQAAVQQRMDVYQQQGVEITPAIQANVENEVFDALVDNRLRVAEMDRLGVEVSDAEVEAAITGENPDPLIRQFFSDGQGGVSREALLQFIQEAPPEQLRALEEEVRNSRRQAKLDALIAATARVSEGEVEDQYVRRSRRATAEYVGLRYANVPDSDVEVTERDLRAFYDAHREDFERPTTHAVEYVVFEKVPSAEDSARVREELVRLQPQLAAAEDPAAWVADNAYGEGAAAFAPAGDLPPELATAVYADPTPGRIVGPVLSGEEGVLARITAVREAENGPYVRGRHILLPAGETARAEEIKRRITGGELSFEQAARNYSTDESNKAQGGELGWFGPGRMVAPFEAAALAAPVGQVVGPVETQFGLHLLRVDAKTNQEAELVRISVPLAGTFDRLIEQAEDLQYYAEDEGGSFAEEAERRGLTVQTAQVLDDEPVVPGLEIGSDAVRWIRRAEPGAISEPFDAGERFAVFHLTERLPEGVRPLDEVQAEIEPRVLLEKKEAATVARLREALAAGGDLAAVAARVGAAVVPLQDLTLSNPIVPGVGREPALIGTVFGLDPSEVSGVVAGEAAAFVVRPTAFTGGDLSALTDEERQQIREQILQRKRAEVLQSWMQSLRDDAEIEDLRDEMM